jgi:hypothetical protein
MFGKRPAVFAAVVTAATLVPLAVFGGVGFAKGMPSASEYEYGPSGGQYGKVTICHHTHSKKHPFHTITVSQSALKAHLKHGDTTGACAAAAPSAQKKPGKSGEQHGNSGTHGNSGSSGSDAAGATHGNSGNNGHHGKP